MFAGFGANHVMVILNMDDWLLRKKGYIFMPYEEREQILLALKYVDEVVPQLDFDDTVCYSLEVYKPDYFAKGGDRTAHNIPELSTCLENGIEMLFGVGGGKIQESSGLVHKLTEELERLKSERCKCNDTKNGLCGCHEK